MPWPIKERLQSGTKNGKSTSPCSRAVHAKRSLRLSIDSASLLILKREYQKHLLNLSKTPHIRHVFIQLLETLSLASTAVDNDSVDLFIEKKLMKLPTDSNQNTSAGKNNNAAELINKYGINFHGPPTPLPPKFFKSKSGSTDNPSTNSWRKIFPK